VSSIMPRNATRDAILILSLFIILVIGGVLFLRKAPAPKPPYHPQAKAAGGTLVLWRWLEQMNYQVQTLPAGTTDLPGEVDVAIFFPGREAFSAEDAEMLHDWAAAGHTLVLVDLLPDEALSEQFGVWEQRSTETLLVPQLFQDLPLLPQAPATLTAPILTDQRLDISDAPDTLPVLSHHLRTKNYPVAAVQTVGDGVVWHLAPQAAPTNEALQGEMGYLVPALLRSVPEGGVILMDLYHPLAVPENVIRPARKLTLAGYFFRTAWGRATLLAGLMLFLFLLLQGRRLGPPLPAVRETRRREAAEYVQALAWLKQRAHQRKAVARYQHQRFRAGLANAWHIDAGLPAAEFIIALQRSDAPPSPELLQRIEQTLTGLDAAPSESDLVRLAAEAGEILHEAGHHS